MSRRRRLACLFLLATFIAASLSCLEWPSLSTGIFLFVVCSLLTGILDDCHHGLLTNTNTSPNLYSICFLQRACILFIFLGFFLRRHYDSLTLHPIGMDVLRISSSPSPFHSYQSGCGLCRTCMDFIIPYNGDLMGFSGQRYLSMCHTWTITVASETDRPYAPNVQYENVFYRLTLNCTIGRYSGKPCCHVHASGRVLNRVPAGKSFMNSTFRK